MLVAVGTFTVAAILIVLLPGPDTLVVVRNLIRGGRRTAIRTVFGVLSGLVIWVCAAALGLSAILSASHDAYLALRIAGAAYLVWLGVQSLRSRGNLSQEPAVDASSRRRQLLATGFPAGIASDLLNPKVGVFFVTFLPGFVPHGYSVGWMSLLLGGIFLALTALYFAILIAASGPVTRWIANTRIRRRMDRITGLILIGFGARLAIEP
ncbi:MAG: Lysine exporter protein [Mycobacterium sp.]|jgi:threonine/homoserine/homoserine lactone efflux protein|nr:Lysine exporter protein [Mycobacterium sp.]